MSTRRHFPQLYALMVLGMSLSAFGAPRAEELMPISNESYADFTKIASAYATALKGSALTNEEEESLRIGSGATLQRHTRSLGGGRVLDRKVSHFLLTGAQLHARSEHEKHLLISPSARQSWESCSTARRYESPTSSLRFEQFQSFQEQASG